MSNNSQNPRQKLEADTAHLKRKLFAAEAELPALARARDEANLSYQLAPNLQRQLLLGGPEIVLQFVATHGMRQRAPLQFQPARPTSPVKPKRLLQVSLWIVSPI